MEMPTVQGPSLRTVLRRMGDAAGAFVRRAGTLILASMVIGLGAALFPVPGRRRAGEYEDRIADRSAPSSDEAKAIHAEWSRNSYLGRFGRAIEPAVRPLGWDWRIGVAALASFPAREVVVGTLGIVYQAGKVESDDDPRRRLVRRRRDRARQGAAGGDLGRHRPAGVHGADRVVAAGVLRPVLSVRQHAGGDPPRDALAGAGRCSRSPT